jgi:NADH-quinone oxidoreductase subunit M
VEGLPQALLLLWPVTPILGAVVVGLCRPGAEKTLRSLGLFFSAMTLAFWFLLQLLLPRGSGELVSWQWSWVPDFGAGLHLGLDGIGLMMGGMVSFLAVVAVMGTLPSQPELNRSHIALLLLAEGGMLGVVTAWDLILFLSFWEVTLVPFFFLMGRGSGGAAPATRFFVTSLCSSVLMWVGVLSLVLTAGTPRTFDLLELSERLGCGSHAGYSSIWFFAPAFIMRMAAFPLHTWFPVVQSTVPTAAGILLAGGVLPLGGFGLIHVALRLFGSNLDGAADWFMWIGVVTALGGSFASIVQRDLKRLIAYGCLSQMGLSLVGLSVPDDLAHLGGLMLLLAVGLGGASLFLYAGVICRARGSQRISDIGGLWRAHPGFAGVSFVAVASMAALPGTAGFVGVFLIFRGIVRTPWPLALSAGACLLTGVSFIWVYRRLNGGNFQRGMWSENAWPLKRQSLMLVALAAAILSAGIMPDWFAPKSWNVTRDCSAHEAVCKGEKERGKGVIP